MFGEAEQSCQRTCETTPNARPSSLSTQTSMRPSATGYLIRPHDQGHPEAYETKATTADAAAGARIQWCHAAEAIELTATVASDPCWIKAARAAARRRWPGVSAALSLRRHAAYAVPHREVAISSQLIHHVARTNLLRSALSVPGSEGGQADGGCTGAADRVLELRLGSWMPVRTSARLPRRQ